MADSRTTLILRIVDSAGKFTHRKIDYEIRHRRLSERAAEKDVDAAQAIEIHGLRRAPEGDYQITVTPSGEHRPQTQFVNVPASGAATVTFVLRGTGKDDSEDDKLVLLPELYVVGGNVTSAERVVNGGLRVEIVDKGVGPDFPLTGALTDDRGDYLAQFPGAKVRERGKLRPDIQARVYDGDTFLAASDVRYDADEREHLDVLVPGDAATLPAEYRTLIASLSRHFQGLLRELKEDDERQDIAYLANKSGWDARAVALASLADKFGASETRVRPELYYALFRAGLPADPHALYQSDARTVERIWKDAVAQGVIARELEQEIPRAVEAFVDASAQAMLAAPPLAGTSSLREMLSASKLEPGQQTRFAELYARHRDDLPELWKSVSAELGPVAANRLQVDGKLAFLTLNNAPLVTQLHTAGEIADPAELAKRGLHRSAAWRPLLAENVAIPKEIPGDTIEARRENYASYLAAQIRISYPTASVAELVKSGDVRVSEAAGVRSFLEQHHGKFEIGAEPVERYLHRNSVEAPAEVVAEVKKLQRLYQITPGDEAMAALTKEGIDSAHGVVRYSKDAFVERFGGPIGSQRIASATYDRAMQVHNAVLNVAVGYLYQKTGMGLGAREFQPDGLDWGILDPQPVPPNADDVIAYPTLESLFGSMDFCACDHCRSVLSPAAYLVDLLQFIDDITPPAGKQNPQKVLLDRRPDLQHLPLTCENTNVALPYIDIVNETMEYFIANSVQKLSLKNFAGHDTGTSLSEDLLAAPQFVIDTAYSTLRDTHFPPPLPFDQPLEQLRRYFDNFEVPMPLAMERLRRSDDLERGGNPYGWRDILLEELHLSRAEADILTDRTEVPLAKMYGFPDGTSNAAVIAALVNAKTYARRTGITYEELVAILRTRFINPASDLIPRLERLGVPYEMIVELKMKNDALTDQKFDDLLPKGAGKIDPAEYAGDVKGWVRNQKNFDRIMKLITLTDMNPGGDPCDFGAFELRLAKPAAGPGDLSSRIGAVELVRMMRFIRLWKKTGWTIEQTDAAIMALFREDLGPVTDADLDSLAELDTGFRVLLPRLGFLVRAMKALKLNVKKDLLSLLVLWSNIGTHGDSALYRQMFLNPALLAQDDVFRANVNGEYLADGSKKLFAHAEALRSAFTLMGEEYDALTGALGFDSNTPLSPANVSAIYRRGWLARKLRVSVRELDLLSRMTGLDPFAAPDVQPAPDSEPPLLRLIAFLQMLKGQSVKTAVALYLIWNEDLSGKSAPTAAQSDELARTLRADFAAIDGQFTAVEDPAGDIARARMTLAYGEEPAAAFFALIDGTLATDVTYTHGAPALEPGITAVDPNLTYDQFLHRLSYKGVLTGARTAALQAATGVSVDFQNAVAALLALSDDAKLSLFTRFPELKPLYDAWIASPDPIEQKRAALLAAFRPELARRRKRQQATQRLSAAANVELPFAVRILAAAAAPYPLHAAGQPSKPALDDIVAIGTTGLAAEFWSSGTAAGPPASQVAAASNLDYGPGNNLPANPAPADPISAVWRGRVEIPEPAFWNFVIEADKDAVVTLTVDGVVRLLTTNGTIRRNSGAIELKGGTLYDLEVKVENVKDVVRIQWESPTRPREAIPGRYLYPPSIVAPFHALYVRFLKSASLAQALRLTAGELAHVTTSPDHRIGGHGWLNALHVAGSPTEAEAKALFHSFEGLLLFAGLNAEFGAEEEQLLSVLRDPVAATTPPATLLQTITQWEPSSVATLLGAFGRTFSDLTDVRLFRRVADAYALVGLMGIGPATLFAATTNAPTATIVRALQTALRARYDATSWRDIVQPVNDALRALQRDALVAYILHAMRSNGATSHIDTADKLFEYFLMDVQMEPCMQTSRIRHALSSVQLFIERCLMNLEPNVGAGSINSVQWVWMKRYRVWEANRKVFLFPENWLDPELRDDKSPFFKEIESELLQSDVTEDSATAAVLNYLGKLDEVAKLEPCALHHVEADEALNTGDVDHVIARTQGANRKYFYRRRDGDGWTPWETVKLDIENNPVAPVVWKGRLILFWLRIMKKGPETSNKGSAPAGTNLTSLTTSNIPSDPEVTYTLTLCWSEYYNGKWQATRTSDIDDPEILHSASARHNLILRLEPVGAALRVVVGSYSGMSYGGYATFLLYNTQSVPVHESPPDWQLVVKGDVFFTSGAYNYFDYTSSEWLTREPIRKNGPSLRVVKARHALDDYRHAPTMLFDARHAFYVSSSTDWVPIFSYPGYTIAVNPSYKERLPPIVVDIEPKRTKPKRPWDDGDPILDPGLVDPFEFRNFVTEDIYIRQGIATAAGVKFGDRTIGPSGAINRKTFRNQG